MSGYPREYHLAHDARNQGIGESGRAREICIGIEYIQTTPLLRKIGAFPLSGEDIILSGENIHLIRVRYSFI
jgi:hypothetical protein